VYSVNVLNAVNPEIYLKVELEVPENYEVWDSFSNISLGLKELFWRNVNLDLKILRVLKVSR
jgi:hypothetical protein